MRIPKMLLHAQAFYRTLSGGVYAALIVAFSLASLGYGNEPLPTPLEKADFGRLSMAAEISAYLKRLERTYPQARVETFGASVQQRPLEALLLTTNQEANESPSSRLTIQIVGAQHGTEAAGAETLLFVARDLLEGPLRPLLNDVDVILIPNANPDGRENGRRANANRINLNTDFVALTQPESRALIAFLQRHRPEVVLDVHESAVLKRKSLAREGYMTIFTTQFEFANNPNIVPDLRRFSAANVLVPWAVAVREAGLPSHRYIGEIRSSRQPLTNGGLTLNNYRNRAGIEGALSFLMETRLDPRDGDYPTFRNIRERVRIQRICIEHFLKIVHEQRAHILNTVDAARRREDVAPLVLAAQYGPALGHARLPIELQRIADGKRERIEFADHRAVITSEPLPMPAAYVIGTHQAELRALLDRNGITYRILDAPRSEWVIEFAVPAAATPEATLDGVRERVVFVRAKTGDLWIDLSQPRGRLAAAILDPSSTSSIWRTPEFFALISAEKLLPIHRVPR